MTIQHRFFSRRNLFAHGAGLFALAGLSPFAAREAGAKTMVCFDPKIGSDNMRVALNYTEKAKNHVKICDVCKFFTANSEACGMCTVMKGPVNPVGTCDSWKEKKEG